MQILRYALDDNPASSGLQLDSTSNGNDATSYSGMSSGDVVTGQVGQAINHDGNDGAIFGTSLPYAEEFTASMWWRSPISCFSSSKGACNARSGRFGSALCFLRCRSRRPPPPFAYLRPLNWHSFMTVPPPPFYYLRTIKGISFMTVPPPLLLPADYEGDLLHDSVPFSRHILAHGRPSKK